MQAATSATANVPQEVRDTFQKGKEHKKTLVIEIGNVWARIGFAGDALPLLTIPACVGFPRGIRFVEDSNSKDLYVGVDALAKRLEGYSSLYSILEFGELNNQQNCEHFLKRVLLNECGLNLAELAGVLVVSPTSQSYITRQHLTGMLFETFNVPRLQFFSDAVSAAVAAQRSSSAALVVHFGERITSIVPIFEGIDVSYAALKVEIGGDEITEQLTKMINQRGHSLTSFADKHFVEKEIKEKYAFVSLEFPADSQAAEKFDQVCTLPNGQSVTLGTERFKCTEIFFDPSPVQSSRPGIHELIALVIKKFDEEIQAQLWSNILLVGGTAKLVGLDQRLENELKLLAPQGCSVCIAPVADKINAIWSGASLIASSLPDSNWIVREEYEEVGPVISRQKIAIYTPPN